MKIIKNCQNKQKTLTQKQKIILTIFLIVIIIIMSIIIFVNINKTKETEKNQKNNVQAITTEGIIKEETYKNLKFDNIILMKNKNMYTMTLDVTNPTENTISLKQVYIDINDKKGNVIGTFIGHIGDDMKPNEKRAITASATNSFDKAYSKTIRE